MLTVNLKGGIGNQLFQIAAGAKIASETGRKFYIDTRVSPSTHHSVQNYFDSLLKHYAGLYSERVPTCQIEEPSYEYRIWPLKDPIVKLDGYFQNYRYIPESFASTLCFPSDTPEWQGAFLHIRGGDYVNHSFHDVGLDSYYRRAIKCFPPGTHFFVFTNDLPYAKSKKFLEGVSHSFIDTKDEVLSLLRMSRCKIGGICANSTFSWWGAYLNRNRTLVLPSKWFNDPKMYVDGYFFPGCIVLPTNPG